VCPQSINTYYAFASMVCLIMRNKTTSGINIALRVRRRFDLCLKLAEAEEREPLRRRSPFANVGNQSARRVISENGLPQQNVYASFWKPSRETMAPFETFRIEMFRGEASSFLLSPFDEPRSSNNQMFAIISRGKTRDEYLGQHQQVAIRSFFSPRFFLGLGVSGVRSGSRESFNS